MGVILQVALPSRVLAAARLQCGAAGAGASRGLGVCAEHARLAARGESARAMEIGDFLVGLGPGATRSVYRAARAVNRKGQLHPDRCISISATNEGMVWCTRRSGRSSVL